MQPTDQSRSVGRNNRDLAQEIMTRGQRGVRLRRPEIQDKSAWKAGTPLERERGGTRPLFLTERAEVLKKRLALLGQVQVREGVRSLACVPPQPLSFCSPP